MKFEQKTVILKNGQKCILKSPEIDNAEEVLNQIRKTSGETNFMARYADELTMSVEDEEKYLENLNKSPKNILIAAFIDGKIAATSGFNCVGPMDRYQHRAEFGISVLKDYWHIGVGTAVIEAVIGSAKKAGYEQLELEVVADNERAFNLYKKLGFKVYGTREKSFKYRDGTYAAEHLMILSL